MSSLDRETPAIRKSTLRLGERRIAHAQGLFDVHFFRDLANETTAMAISTGDLGGSAPLLLRVHSSCVTSEGLGGRDCDCAEQLAGALGAMAEAGRGVVFYLMQEGRGAGLTAKARDRMMVQASRNRIDTFEAYAAMGLPSDLRRYEIVAPMSRLLGLQSPIRLLSNNPEKVEGVIDALQSEKLEVAGTESIRGRASRFNRDYLRAKSDAGHSLSIGEGEPGALPPFDVSVIEPISVPGAPALVLTASYFLPIALDSMEAPDWFRMSVVYDREEQRESVLLSHAADGEASEVAGRVAEGESGSRPFLKLDLLDRLPFDAAGRHALGDALRVIRDRRSGAVRVGFDARDLARDDR